MHVRFHLIRLGRAVTLTKAGGGMLVPEDFGPLRWM
jgi:hypothetical protein